MKYNRFLGLTLACLMVPFSAGAQTTEISGTVVAGYETSVSAPFGGVIAAVHMREGEWVEAGQPLATIRTTKVFAPVDGTVSSVLSDAGDTADGTVMSVAPVAKYTVSASVSEQYGSDDAASRYVRLGETVYLRCQKDRSHVAVGRVTAAEGATYTVETTGGELYLEESVNIYRSGDYAFASLIGAGTVARTAAWELSGSGSLLRLYVAEGEAVERGQLLFETVEGPLDGYSAQSNDILSAAAGVLSGVTLTAGARLQKGAPVAVLYPREGFQLAAVVPEDMLTLIKEGDQLRFYLDWNEDEPRWYEGTVAELSYISATTAENTTAFTAYLDFDADESVRLGMTAVVELKEP